MRSQKIQDKASQVRFDFTDISQVFEKIEEEISGENIRHEIGDILTAVVELARFVGVDAETALQSANERFMEMDRLWEEGKKKIEQQ